MIYYMIISLVLYAFCIPVFILSASSLIIISFIHFPLFFKVDKFFCRLIIMSLGVRTKIIGSFPKDGTYIIMMNHSSFVDVFLFPLVLRGVYTGVTALENFKYPIFSSLIRRLKAIPIDRKNRQSAMRSIEKAERILKKGVHIGILPEGSRTITGNMQTLKKGGFHMAINTKTPIVPVGISGAFKFKPKNRWWLRPGLITINIGRPINQEDYRSLGVNGLLARVELILRYLSGEYDENI